MSIAGDTRGDLKIEIRCVVSAYSIGRDSLGQETASVEFHPIGGREPFSVDVSMAEVRAIQKLAEKNRDVTLTIEPASR